MSGTPPINIQDIFLNHMRKGNVEGTFFLVNGFQIRGKVKSFDKFVIVLDSSGKQNLIFKHAISTIVPDVVIEWNK
jgi:host factor-I protein